MEQTNFKLEFGKLFREARDKRGLSRLALGQRLNISPKTIQSWENGRTFPEDLSLLPVIETELGISIFHIMESLSGKADSGDGKNLVESAVRRYRHPAAIAGPASANLQFINSLADVQAGQSAYAAVPLIKTDLDSEPSAMPLPEEIEKLCLFPADLVAGRDSLIAFRMRDSLMMPNIPKGAVVVFDRAQNQLEQLEGCIVALWLKGRGLRIRRLKKDKTSQALFGATDCPSGRGGMDFNPAAGDKVIGKALSLMASLEE